MSQSLGPYSNLRPVSSVVVARGEASVIVIKRGRFGSNRRDISCQHNSYRDRSSTYHIEIASVNI